MKDRYSGEQSTELGDSQGKIMERQDIIKHLSVFIENETRSCSMDFGGITPEYVYRMLGGQYSIDEIQDVLSVCLKDFYERERTC